MKHILQGLKRAVLAIGVLGAALVAPQASRPVQAALPVNGPLLALAGMHGEGGSAPYSSLVSVSSTGVSILARQTPNTFAALAPSPRGRYVAIAGGTAGLWEADVDGRHLHAVLPSPTVVSAVDWSPDRFTLAYVTGTGAAYGVYLARYDGSGPHPLVKTAGLEAALGPGVRDLSIGRLSWSSDGKTIAVSVASDLLPGIGFAVLLVDAATGRARSTISGVFDASFSPVAPLLAYLKPAPTSGGQPSASFALTISNAIGRRSRMLFSTPHFVQDPVWSPDGAALAYIWDPGTVEKLYMGGAEVHAVDLASGVVRTIAAGAGPVLHGETFEALAWPRVKL